MAGQPIVTELASATNDPRLVLGLEPLELDQVERLVVLLDAGGPVTVKLSAASPEVEAMVFGPRSQQRLEPINGHYPESDAQGGPVPDLVKRWWKARAVLLRV